MFIPSSQETKFKNLIERRVKLTNSNYIEHDTLMQKQAEVMCQYEDILFERIARIMHESDKVACETAIRCN